MKIAGFLLVVFTTAFLPVLALAGTGDDIMVVEGKRIYLVKPGDTLGLIAGRIYGDPGRWQEIWRANPQIKSPNLIFPGDTLIVGEEPMAAASAAGGEPPPTESASLPARERAPVTLAPEELMAALREEPEPVIIFTAAPVREAPGISPGLYESCGYISPELPEVRVIGSAEGKQALSTFDVLFINRGDRDGLVIGEEFRVLRPIRIVRHPQTGVSMGWLVKVVGRVRAECLQERTATARVVVSLDYITEGDRLESYVPTAIPSDHYLSAKLAGPCLPATGGTGAHILAAKDDKQVLGEGDIVYVDRGLASGITPGFRMAVYRQGLPGEGRGSYLVGELQVLLSQNYTSTALVTNSLGVISTSDKVATW